MWSAPEEPPGAMEEGPPEPVMQVKEKCEQNKSQLESFKEIMLRNQETLKKKEEEVEEYARRLSKIKSRSKLSRRSKEATASPKDVLQTSKSEAAGSEIPEEAVEDISQAITPKAKSTLLQKKLAENRKVFEQRNKKLTESKRAVEEKVEAIRQQLEEKDVALQKDQLPATPVRSVLPVTDSSSAVQVEILQEKENKIADLSNKILQLEATVLDLQENLKEKDSVIESKTKAVTLMSADLSKKGKTTLDQLEDTKDEMRSMQEHFILLETSLKDKNDSLLDQLKERDDRISGLEDVIKKFELQIDEQQKSTSATVDFSRSTMDTLIETKDAMKSMQENFVLIETSLKAKNDNLLKQLETYEIKLAEANERVFQLESGMGIVKSPSIDDLQFKIDKLEESNKQLQDEKYELQKSIAEMQDQIVNRSLVPNSGALLEKDNRIAELENLVEELKQSNKLLEEESKTELQKQLEALSIKNEEYSNKITDLEKLVNDLETEKSSIAARLPDESAIGKDDDKVLKLTKELDELNKTMIKMKAQHRSKVKNLQKQLENFKMVSDKNAELVRLGNQVALLEEEKASAGDWQERIADLESKVSTQTNEIQTHIEAIAALENQKLDLMQELHVAKQELSALEAENAESENLRVTAEMKVVDLEEQLDTLQRLQKESAGATIENSSELLKKIEDLTQENSELYNKLSKLEEKSASESGSTESFENIQELDKTELLKKLEELTQKNNELTEKVMKLEEKNNSQAGSTESFETINDGDKNVLLKKIDQLTQENSDLTMKLSRFEEKGSSDTGSTESFERIPEHGESLSKIEMLTQENQELLAKLTKLEQQLIYVKSSDDSGSKDDKSQLELLVQENSNQSQELETLKERVSNLLEENNLLQSRIDVLLADNNQLVFPVQQEHVDQLDSAETIADRHERVVRDVESNEKIDTLVREKSLLEKEMKELRNALEQLNKAPEEDQTSTLQTKIQELIDENVRYNAQISDLEESNNNLKDDLNKLAHERDELLERIEQMTLDDFARERRELIDKLEKINQEKENVARERQELQEQINDLVHKASEESTQIRREEDAEQDSATAIVATLEREIEECKKLISEQADIIEDMKMKVAHKEKELEETHQKVKDYEVSGEKAESLEQELKEMLSTMEEWKYKCNEMQNKINILEAGKASIEEGFRILQSEHENLLEQTKEKETVNNLQQEEFKSTIIVLEDKLQEARSMLLIKEEEISSLKETIEIKENELQAKYVQLQNELITLDSLQDELHTYKLQIREKEAMIDTLTQEVENLNSIMRTKDEEIYSLRREVTELDEKLSRTKSLDEYNAMLEAMESKDAMFNELQNKFEEHRKESNEASIQVQKLLEEKDNVESQLKRLMQEFSDLMSVKEDLETRLAEADVEKTTAERRVWELQSILDNNARFIDDLQEELKNVYRQVELLKLKHTEDMEMQNRRLEDLMEELNTKTQENDAMKVELEEKEHLIGQNITEETTAALRAQVSSLEEKLVAAEDKIHAQIEKMKKIAANLKKKTALCQELEARIVELEEKLTSEKDEKEAKNKQIQEVEISMREKDNRILELEEKLTQARSEIAESDINLEKITKEYSTSKEKISLLTEQITEMEGEILKLRADVEAQNVELATEKEDKQSVQIMFENYKQEVMQDNKDKESELEEVKEKARELSVRMEVMEKEYVEQLALINNLKAENRLLLSRQAQISEKLENVEQESEERRAIIEELRKQVCETIDVSTQVLEEDLLEGESKETHCSNCEQCQTIIQALEAKLQERDAEIKNLDNELANSVGNFVEMREELRVNDLMNETATRNRNLEEEKEDLLHRNNILQESIKEIEFKLQEAIEQNNILSGKVNDLVAVNASLEERVRERETERDFNQQDESKPEKDKEVQENEKKILSLQEELQATKKHADELEKELSLRLSESEAEKQNSEAKIKTLIEAQQESEQRIAELEAAVDRSRSQELQSDEPIAIKEEAAVDVAASGSNTQDNVPQLFDASKIFGTSYAPDSDILSNEEVTKLQNELREKEAHCANLTQEIHDLRQKIVEERSQLTQDCSRCTDELKATQERLNAAEVDLAKLESLVTEKNAQIDSLNTELSNVDLQIMAQCNQQEETDSKLEELVSLKDNQINELKAELSSTTEILEVLTAERDQQVRLLESNRVQIANLEAELRNSTDTELIQELEKKISETLKERDFLQLQVNDLTRSMDDLQQTIESRRNLQKEVETALREKAEAKEIAANLMRALEEARKSSDELSARDSPVPQDAEIDSTPADVPTVSPLNIETVEAGKSSEETVEKATALDIGSGFNVEDEMWDWNPDDVQMVDPQLAPTLVPNQEAQLLTKIDELEDRIKELQTEKDKIEEENKVAQVRSAKLIKKLKEYKVQVENLQQQLKIQKSASGFYELDSAIEEELKAQISKLEKTLKEAKDEQRNNTAEKEALLKRLDVVVSANERYMEMKEKQDMELEVMRIQNKELANKVQALDKQLQGSPCDGDKPDSEAKEHEEGLSEETSASTSTKQRHKRSIDESSNLEALCNKYKNEIDELKDEMEALASENDQLQQILAELKNKASNSDKQLLNEKDQMITELTDRSTELEVMLTKTKEEYDQLRRQYEQSLMDANDQVSAMRENAELLKLESRERGNKLQEEIITLQHQLVASDSRSETLHRDLENALQENSRLEEKVSQLQTSEEKLLVANSSLAEVTDLLNTRIQEVADLKQELQRQYIDREGAEAKLQDMIQSLTAELNERKHELDNLRRSLSDKESELIQRQSVETVSAIVSQATEELMQKHAIELEEKDIEIRSLGEKLATLQLAVDEYSLEMQSNVGKLAAQQEEFDLLKQALMEKESLISSLQSDLQSAREDLVRNEAELSKHSETSHETIIEKGKLLEELNRLQSELNESKIITVNLEEQLHGLKSSLLEKDSVIEMHNVEFKQQNIQNQAYVDEIQHLTMQLQEINVLRFEIENKTEEIMQLSSELESTRIALEETRKNLEEKTASLERTSQMLNNKQLELDSFSSGIQNQSQYSSSNIVDGLPLFSMGDNETESLQATIEELKAELEKKQLEIENFKYILNENTYPSMIQELQDQINVLYNEKAGLESSLETATQTVAEKEVQLNEMKKLIEVQSKESVSKEEAASLSRERRSVKDQEEIVKLQNELHSKEQEINDLKYIIAEKDSQLSLASMDSQSDDFELRETVQRLTAELRGKEQEIEQLRKTITDLEKEVSRLSVFEKLSDEYKDAIEKLSAEKEQIRLEGEEFLERRLKENEEAINELKQRLQTENQRILQDLQLREKDLENLKRQLQESKNLEEKLNENLHEKEEELLRVNTELTEKERRLAELSITKDAELHNLKVQIHEKDVRLEELLSLSEEEEKQLAELRNSLDAREIEINNLKALLEDKVKEYELIQYALKKDIPVIDVSPGPSSTSENVTGERNETTSQELDLALYMLHQRDVRCEELTHELMQLLEERDTLQLRLSNAIRVNEELRRTGASNNSPQKEAASASESEDLLVEHPSPSRSEGPVEIAKEAIDAPIGEDKEALALKLSQLHSVSHSKDVTFKDERELRHTQQMSLLAHKDVLSTLPPEAAARLVNANYTLSRDVQSQSSVLLNWLWGKSTPKVVHM